MPASQRRAAGAGAAPQPEPGANGGEPCPFEEVRQTLARAAADSQCNELTERILRDFLPVAAAVVATQASGQEAYEALSSALLAVACTLCAPIGFLDCVLATPWHALQPGHTGAAGEAGEAWKAPRAAEARRRRFLNLPLPSYLMEPVLDFVYRPEFARSLPPIMQLDEEGAPAGSPNDVRTFVAAALDGGSALHFAAASGRNKQVTWLLANGADLRARTRAGDLPIQLVPKCEEPTPFGGRAGDCRCQADGAACMSQKTREAMAWHTFCDLSYGLWGWLCLLFASLACVLGIDSCHASFFRREIGEHAVVMHVARKRQTRAVVRHSLQRMRARAAEARRLVDRAVALHGPSATRFDLGEPGGDTAMTCSWQQLPPAGIKADARPPEANGNGPRAAGAAEGEGVDTEELLRASLETVTILQDLGLKSVQAGGGWLDVPRSLDEADGELLAPRGPQPPEPALAECAVRAAEQADVFLCMAQAVFVQHRAAGFPGGAAHLADKRMGIACENARLLLAKLERHPERFPGEAAAVGAAFASMLHAHACLLLATHARFSATPGVVAAAQALLTRWADLAAKGHADAAGLSDDVSLACLSAWARTAAADLELAAALRGRPLAPEESLAESVAGATECGTSGCEARLSRAATKDAVRRLQAALDSESAAAASSYLWETAQAAVRAASAEVAAADRLRSVSAARGGRVGAADAIQELQAAIAEASAHRWLEGAVAAARQLLTRWEARATASARLDAAVEAARAPLPPAPAGGDFRAELGARAEALGDAVAAAQVADVPAGTAKKLQAELRAQLGAAEAAERLTALLQSKPCSSAALKASVLKAEAAAAAAGGGGASGHAEGSAALAPLLAAARRRLETERASEQLQRSTAAARGLADLPKLEAAILAARKTGGVDPDVLRAASEVRAGLDRAARAKASLEAAARQLAKSRRAEDAAALEAAIAAAKAEGTPLDQELRAAGEAVGRWQAAAAAQEKLARALEEGSSAAALDWALKEAVAAGVKEAAAGQRVLKAVQSLEAAMQRSEPGNLGLLRDRIAAAEGAGAGASWLRAPRALERRLLLAEVKGTLELALRLRVDRAGALEAAADQAQALLSSDAAAGAELEAGSEAEAGAAALRALLGDARARLAEWALEQERLAEAQAAEARAQEQARAERERERERAARELRQRQEAAEAEAEAARRARAAAKPRPRSSTPPAEVPEAPSNGHSLAASVGHSLAPSNGHSLAASSGHAPAQPVAGASAPAEVLLADKQPSGSATHAGSEPPSTASSRCASPTARAAASSCWAWDPQPPAQPPQPAAAWSTWGPVPEAAPIAPAASGLPFSAGLPAAEPPAAAQGGFESSMFPLPPASLGPQLEPYQPSRCAPGGCSRSVEAAPGARPALTSVSVGAGALAFGAPGLDAFSTGLRPASGKAGSAKAAAAPLDIAAVGFGFDLPHGSRPFGGPPAPGHGQAGEPGARVSSPFPGAHQWAFGAPPQPPPALGGSPAVRLNALSRLEGAAPDLENLLPRNFGHLGFLHRRRPSKGQ